MSSGPELHDIRVKPVIHGSRDNTETAYRVPVVVTGVTSEINAINHAYNNIAKTVNDLGQGDQPGAPYYLVLDDLRIVDSFVDEDDYTNNQFAIEATYVQPWSKDRQLLMGETRVSVDTTGATDRLKYGIAGTPSQTTGDYGYIPTNPPANWDFWKEQFGMAIAVRESDVEGVTIVIPSLRVQVEQLRFVDDIQPQHWVKWMQMTGTVNSARLFNDQFKVGEMLFLGATGGRPVDGLSGAGVVVFNFDVKLNIGNADAGDGGGRPEKTINGLPGEDGSVTIEEAYGHDAIWAYYEPREGGTGNQTTVQPTLRQVNVIQVYPWADHRSLFNDVTLSDPSVVFP